MSGKARSREVPLRIAVAGPASSGKTSLSKLLAEKIGVTWLEEGLRNSLESRSKGTLASWPRGEARLELKRLHLQRVAEEKRLDAFVADTTSLDPIATGLHLGLMGDSEENMLREARQSVASYDAVFVLPHGALPYVRDGLRPDDLMSQLAYAHLIGGLVGSSIERGRLLLIPQELVQVEERCRYVLSRLAAFGLGDDNWATDSESSVSVEAERCGKVYLVGAGPGAPELLTVRAVELIRSADVIAHDRLVPPMLLAIANPKAELLAVGHRGRGSKQLQYRIHPAVVERARNGLKVVRLKAGDPLIFGRGGEEAEALSELGIGFEIVPGISAALGAAAAAGIPLTHRDHASDVTFATGHDLDSGRENLANFEGMAKGHGTLVLYMVSRQLENNLAKLVRLGRSASTPAAYVASAARHDQLVVTGTLADLAYRCRNIDRSQPALVIVGEVVGCRTRVAWCEQRPLAGRRFLLGRARPGISKLAVQLRDLGANIVEEPEVKAHAIATFGKLDACILALEASARNRKVPANALLVASPESAARLVGRWAESERDIRGFPRVPLFAIGPETREALAGYGLKAEETSPGHCIQGLSQFVVEAGTRIWVLGSSRGRPSLMGDLASLGWKAIFVPTYELTQSFSGIDPGPLDAGLFMASSVVHDLFDGPEVLVERLLGAPAFAIGPKTKQALDSRRACQGDVNMPMNDSREGLVSELLKRFRRTSSIVGHAEGLVR